MYERCGVGSFRRGASAASASDGKAVEDGGMLFKMVSEVVGTGPTLQRRNHGTVRRRQNRLISA